MQIIQKPYEDINDTLQHIRYQVARSIPYAAEHCPQFANPFQLFDWLKARTVYRLDPKGNELLQSMQTLMEGNYYGVPGAGDCDCFTITMLACNEIQNYSCRQWVMLAGRSKVSPVHIYSGVDWQGKPLALDLTNQSPGYEREYPLTQKLYWKPL